jgi:hypothetical protein
VSDQRDRVVRAEELGHAVGDVEAIALAMLVQFWPWPKRPWQKATRGPLSPSDVVWRAMGGG